MTTRRLHMLAVLLWLLGLGSGAATAGTGSGPAALRRLPVDASRCEIYAALVGASPRICRADPAGESAPVPGRTRGAAPEQGAVAAGEYDPASREAAPVVLAVASGGYFVFFPFDSAELTPPYRAHVARLAEVLTLPELGETCILLVGHADARGPRGYNIQLSERRAAAVGLALRAEVPALESRIALLGRGEEEPLPGLDPTDGRNRRVEIRVGPMAGGGCRP